MPNYALKVVPGNWDIDMPLPFSAAEYEAVRGTIEPGMRVVIYQGSPVDGLVAEGQVNYSFVRVTEWPEQNLGRLDRNNPENEYVLPMQIHIRQRGPEAIVPRSEVAHILSLPDFPQPEHEWMIVSDEVYQQLIEGWPA